MDHVHLAKLEITVLEDLEIVALNALRVKQ